MKLLLLPAALMILATPLAKTAVFDFKAADKGNRNYQNAEFRAWIPDSLAKVRGVILLTPGHNGDGRGQANDAAWQQLAEKLGAILVASSLQQKEGAASYCVAEEGSGPAVLEALEHFAKESGKPEIKDAPLFLWGHSAGGQFNYNFACWKPERVVGFVVNKGGFNYDSRATPKVRAVPALLFLGEKDTPDRVKNITGLFDDNRSKSALWALCVEAGSGHEEGRTRGLTMRFFEDIAPLRLPAAPAIGSSPPSLKPLSESDGWLGVNESREIQSARTAATGTKKKTSWLATESLANDWKAFVATP